MASQWALVLEIDLRLREQAQQFYQIWGHFLDHVRLDQRSHGWRGWRASPSQDHLHSEAFPTELGCSWAVRLRGQVERLQT